MWTVIALLWLVTLGAHKGYNYLPLDIQPQMFYVARGIAGAALYLLLPYWIGQASTRWQCHALTLCAIYGATEEALTAICGTNFYFVAAGKTFIGSRLCSEMHALNWPTTAILVATLLVMVTYERIRAGER